MVLSFLYHFSAGEIMESIMNFIMVVRNQITSIDSQKEGGGNKAMGEMHH
jgi:hypothetical protein